MKKNPLPWATEIKSQWLPWQSSMRWLRPQDPKERPHGVLAIDPPSGVTRFKNSHTPFIAFADPEAKRELILIGNSRTDQGGDEAMSGEMALVGYVRDYYRNLSVLSLQFDCMRPSRPDFTVRLELKNELFGEPIKRYMLVKVPASFGGAIRQFFDSRTERDTKFYRSIFAAPLGADQGK